MEINRLGIIGDVHGADRQLEASLHFLKGEGVDEIVCVGDITDGIGDAGHCCELLQEFGVLTVCGNHDRWFLAGEMRDLPDVTSAEGFSDAARRFLQALPPTRPLTTIAGPLLLCHGMGANDMRSLLIDDREYAIENNPELQQLLRSREFRFVVCGHTHRRMVRTFEQLTAINPGPLYDAFNAENKTGPAVADFSAGTVLFYDFDREIVVPSRTPVSLAHL